MRVFLCLVTICVVGSLALPLKAMKKRVARAAEPAPPGVHPPPPPGAPPGQGSSSPAVPVNGASPTTATPAPVNGASPTTGTPPHLPNGSPPPTGVHPVNGSTPITGQSGPQLQIAPVQPNGSPPPTPTGAPHSSSVPPPNTPLQPINAQQLVNGQPQGTSSPLPTGHPTGNPPQPGAPHPVSARSVPSTASNSEKDDDDDDDDLDEDDIEEIKEDFNKTDTNHDGQVSMPEIKASIAADFQEMQTKVSAMMDKLFPTFDTNHNGQLDINETMAAQKVFEEQFVALLFGNDNEEDLESNFDAADSNPKDGSVSFDELKTYIRTIFTNNNMKIDENQLSKLQPLFTKADADNNQKLTLIEIEAKPNGEALVNAVTDMFNSNN